MPPSPVLSRGSSASRGYLKRGIDVAIGAVLLIVAVPIIVISALAIRFETEGPAFFRQVRVGRGRRPFTLVKLRTMYHGAERGPAVTLGDDVRITRFGGFLRRTRIDELPQLWNVVRGDMSLVGPRPENPGVVDRYDPAWAPLLEVRPGLTDEATLAFRHEATLLGSELASYERVVLPAKARISLDGVLNKQSVVDDLSVLARTAGTLTGVFRPREHPEFSRVREQLHGGRRTKEA
jgi:lipopolysaccharide/colanic/teichoic acid biosynthesis glycosyltransferase